jgi:dGTPase
MDDSRILPTEWRNLADPQDERATARLVSDYIAGMTDRFAAREHERLTGLKLLA